VCAPDEKASNNFQVLGVVSRAAVSSIETAFSNASALVMKWSADKMHIAVWLPSPHQSPESESCVIPGTNERDKQCEFKEGVAESRIVCATTTASEPSRVSMRQRRPGIYYQYFSAGRISTAPPSRAAGIRAASVIAASMLSAS